jgi:DNA-binding transcriptional MerR regulator
MPYSGFTVGQAAKRIGVSKKAIRLYEERGLLPSVRRSQSGYRLFDDADLGVLRFIRQARAIGLGLDEIKDVLALQRSGQQTCGRVAALLDAHIAEIDRTVSELYDLRATLSAARATADSGGGQNSATVCRIIETDVAVCRVSSENGRDVEGRPVAQDGPRDEMVSRLVRR